LHRAATEKIINYPGKDGFSELEYIGTESLETFCGVVTNATYLAGTKRAIILVDLWDMPNLINMGDFRRNMTEQKKKRTVERIDVRVLGKQDDSVLCEAVVDGKAERRFVPARSLKDDTVTKSTFLKSPMYGIPWESLELEPITGDKLAQALHNAGIWTFEDAAQNNQAILGALQQIYSLDVSAILRFAKSYK